MRKPHKIHTVRHNIINMVLLIASPILLVIIVIHSNFCEIFSIRVIQNDSVENANAKVNFINKKYIFIK